MGTINLRRQSRESGHFDLVSEELARAVDLVKLEFGYIMWASSGTRRGDDGFALSGDGTTLFEQRLYNVLHCGKSSVMAYTAVAIMRRTVRVPRMR